MTAPASPLADFYPTTFKQDLNGAHAAWKAVPLLPFIEQAGDRVRARVRVPLLPFIEQDRLRRCLAINLILTLSLSLSLSLSLALTLTLTLTRTGCGAR